LGKVEKVAVRSGVMSASVNVIEVRWSGGGSSGKGAI
jgi:hypothetical protein